MSKTFRSSAWAIVVQMMVIYWALTFLRRGFYLVTEDRWIPIYNSTLISGTLVILVVSLVVAWFYKVEVTNQTIKGPNIWGGFSSISLNEEYELRKVGIPLFRYLKIIGKTKRTVWIAMPVGNESELLSHLEKSTDQRT
jgi:hypothetical protein